MENRKILIISDSPDRKSFIEYYIRNQGFSPVWYPNIMSAYLAVKKDPFSLVVVDLSIPVEPKLELIRECLRLHPGIIIIIIGKSEYLKKYRPLPEVPTIVNISSIALFPDFLPSYLPKVQT